MAAGGHQIVFLSYYVHIVGHMICILFLYFVFVIFGATLGSHGYNLSLDVF